ncbi:MAG: hypothetical protein WC595_01655 [Candidatus Nanoarchaeia archaeon]|jgi:hypothetical protein
MQNYTEDIVEYRINFKSRIIERDWDIYDKERRREIKEQTEQYFLERAYELAIQQRLIERMSVNTFCADTEGGYTAFNLFEIVIDPQTDTTASYKPFSLEDLTDRSGKN